MAAFKNSFFRIYHVKISCSLKSIDICSFKLIKKLWEDKNLPTFPYCKAQIFEFLNLRMEASTISPTAIVKMWSISCFLLFLDCKHHHK